MELQEAETWDQDFKRYKYGTDFVIVWLIRRGKTLGNPDAASITKEEIIAYLQWNRLPKAQKDQSFAESNRDSKSLIALTRLVPIATWIADHWNHPRGHSIPRKFQQMLDEAIRGRTESMKRHGYDKAHAFILDCLVKIREILRPLFRRGQSLGALENEQFDQEWLDLEEALYDPADFDPCESAAQPAYPGEPPNVLRAEDWPLLDFSEQEADIPRGTVETVTDGAQKGTQTEKPLNKGMPISYSEALRRPQAATSSFVDFAPRDGVSTAATARPSLTSVMPLPYSEALRRPPPSMARPKQMARLMPARRTSSAPTSSAHLSHRHF